MRQCYFSRRPLALKLQRRTTLFGFLVNATAATLCAVYMLVVFPPEEDVLVTRELAAVATALYTVICGLTAHRRARPLFRQIHEWLAAGRPPTPEERRLVLRAPAFFARLTFYRWALAVPLFALPDLQVSTALAMEVATITALAGLIVTAAAYLTIERIMRPALALALDSSSPPEAHSLGIGPRLLLTWLLCSGVPILMLALIPVGRDVDDPDQLVAPIWFTAAVGLAAGFVFTKLATQAVARPIRELRRATDSVREGDLGATVPVDDGSEVGRLQAGFNGMVAGLRERERLRDLYGRQVGTDVAQEALARGWELGGETREVSALFVDVIGSTGLAQREPPERVVALLNEFFAAVVETVDRHCGLVNKFEGDAALVVFGAPVPQEDHAARALATARELRSRIDAMEAFDAAIGVASGVAVAGYVGAETRFEYTVVGDPVNEAARLTELAKEHPLRLLASGETLRAAGEIESARWSFDGEAVLRGRGMPTRLAVPA